MTELRLLKYGSVCSGIESASLAWEELGFVPVFFSEIESYPRSILKDRWGDVPLHGDFTTIRGDEYGSIDVLVGGTPCAAFSVAGLREGMDDHRGNLAKEFIRLAYRKNARWVVWENVPGVLSSNGGKDFGSFLGGLAECGYGFAYRVLDAKYFGVPQQRRRVFVVGYIGDWQRPAAVLFERGILSGNTNKSGKKRGGFAEDSSKSVYAVHNKATRYKGGGETRNNDGAGNGLGIRDSGLPAYTLTAGDDHAVSYLHDDVPVIRKFTPVECERLQGIPEGHTKIEGGSNRKRYERCGRAMAVPVMRWIGERIMGVENETGI